MRVLFVVQRYGRDVAGGAERACREFATHLAARGRAVEALTTCALSYVDWANHYPAGTEDLDGVAVHRLNVAKPRDSRVFAELNARVVSRAPTAAHLQREWMRLQGPFVPELRQWLRERGPSFDVVVFFSYLYFTAWAGLASVPRTTPTVLHPTAHDEPPLGLPLFDVLFRLPAALAFCVEEEAALVARRFRVGQPWDVIGVGTDLDVDGDAARFREAVGLDDRPYLLFVGRVDPGKGSEELGAYFRAYKSRNPGPLALAIVGDPVQRPEPHADVIVTGYVDEETKRGAYAGALAFVQPSYFESFSMVLAEAWAMRVPALVQGRCDVLMGQARRSRGALAYSGFAEFEAAVDWLVADPSLRRHLGERGRAYVERRYRWENVIDRYERWLEEVVTLARRW